MILQLEELEGLLGCLGRCSSNFSTPLIYGVILSVLSVTWHA